MLLWREWTTKRTRSEKKRVDHWETSEETKTRRERERERERVEKWRNEQNNKMYKLAWVPPKFGQVA